LTTLHKKLSFVLNTPKYWLGITSLKTTSLTWRENMVAYNQSSHRELIPKRKKRPIFKPLLTNGFLLILALCTVFLNTSSINKFFIYEESGLQPARRMHESTVVRLRRLSNAQLPFATTANPAVRTNRRAQAVEKKRFAVVRTFSPNDSEKLVPSFDSWDVFPPCSSGFYSYYTIDLFLSYSQLLSSNAEAQSAVDEVIKKFTTTEGWGKCLNEVHVIEANIEPEFDLYEPASVQKNPLWVNGPNRQFIHSYRSIQQRNPKYEAMIALEPDSHPRIEDWLEGLLEEVEANAPLAILGR